MADQKLLEPLGVTSGAPALSFYSKTNMLQIGASFSPGPRTRRPTEQEPTNLQSPTGNLSNIQNGGIVSCCDLGDGLLLQHNPKTN